MTTINVHDAKALYDDGLTLREVGKRLGCSHTAVRRLFERHGIERRRSNAEPRPDDQLLTHLLSRCVEVNGCWVWGGYTNAKGYGRTGYKRRGQIRATHRLVYELMVGPIPDGLELDHLCRNPPCCNPYHLEPVTQAVNLDRQRQAVAVT